MHLDVVDCHLADLALSGVLQVVAGTLSWLQLCEGGHGLLLSKLCLSHGLGKQLAGRSGQLWCITQANGGTHLQAEKKGFKWE